MPDEAAWNGVINGSFHDNSKRYRCTLPTYPKPKWGRRGRRALHHSIQPSWKLPKTEQPRLIQPLSRALASHTRGNKEPDARCRLAWLDQWWPWRIRGLYQGLRGQVSCRPFSYQQTRLHLHLHLPRFCSHFLHTKHIGHNHNVWQATPEKRLLNTGRYLG